MNTKTSQKFVSQNQSGQVNTSQTTRIRSCVDNKVKASLVSVPQQKSARTKRSENTSFDFVGLAG